MNQETPIKTVFSQQDLKLYVFGSRQADQFWVPTGSSYSRKPFCLTDVQKFTFNNEEDEDAPKQPIPNPLFHEVVSKISCGSIHSIVLLTDGRVFTFGCNDQGALGRKGIECLPTQVQLEDPIDLIAAGDNHSLFANSANGAIYFTGNYNYKRGEMMRDPVKQPIRTYSHEINIYNKNKKIDKLSCGSNHSCILVAGRLYCRGEPQASTIGRRMSKRHKVQNSLTFNGVNLTNVIDVECGGYHTIAVVCGKDDEKKYFSWGTNDHGQLGIGSFQSQAFPVEIQKLRGKSILKIAGGAAFSMFLDDKGDLYSCGNNEYNMLGLGEDYECSEDDDEEEDKEQSNQEKQDVEKSKKPQNQQMIDESLKPITKPSQINVSLQPLPQVQPQLQPQTNQLVTSPTQPVQQDQKQTNSNHDQPDKQKQESTKNLYIKSLKKIPVPEKITGIGAGQNFGFAWNKQSMYSWGMGVGYVLLTGEQNDQMQIFKVKNKIINNHTIYELDAGNQHVLYTSYPDTIDKSTVKVEQKPSVYQNLSIAKHGLKRKR